ncbi:MAG: sigma-70 family RNA polymerase sigma factor [Verrucomicrobiota bacterium]
MSDRDAFLTTCWTEVLAAKGNSKEARVALGEMCDGYYAPVVAFLRSEGRSDDRARELAHNFFAWLLARDTLTRLERGKGKFRSYLLGSLKHYLGHERARHKRLKRGGGVRHESLGNETEIPTPGPEPGAGISLPPDREFDRQWALHILKEAMRGIEAEWRSAGKEALWDQLKPFLDGETKHGDLALLAERTGRKESTLRSDLHRLRRGFRGQVKRRIAPTLGEGEALIDEMEILFAALAGRP